MGLAAAAANGREGGRPCKVDDADAVKAGQLREKGIAGTDIAKMLGVSRATVYPRSRPIHLGRLSAYLGYFTSHHAGSMPLSFSMRSADSLPLRRATHWFFIQL